MFHEVVSDPGERAPKELYELYQSELAAIVESRGIEAVAEASGIDEATLQEIVDQEASDLTLEEAASVLAVREDTPDDGTIATTARDELLMGMTTAVLDVEAVESGIGGELEAREIQSKIEGRFPITLREFALLYQYIESQQ